MSYLINVGGIKHGVGMCTLSEDDGVFTVAAISNSLGYKRVFKDIKANTPLEAEKAVMVIIKESFKRVFLKDNRFTSGTLILAKMKPQTNSGRFHEHILDSRSGYGWVKGYIVEECCGHMIVLVDDKYKVECFKDDVIIMN